MEQKGSKPFLVWRLPWTIRVLDQGPLQMSISALGRRRD